MAVENVNSKPIAASAAIADFILASIGGKVAFFHAGDLEASPRDFERHISQRVFLKVRNGIDIDISPHVPILLSIEVQYH